MLVRLFKCPCCGYYMLGGEPFEICNVCFWECGGMENDSLRYAPTVSDGANEVSLIQACRNYKIFGAMSERLIPYVSPP